MKKFHDIYKPLKSHKNDNWVSFVAEEQIQDAYMEIFRTIDL